MFALLVSHGSLDNPMLQAGTPRRQHHIEVHASEDLSVVGMYTPGRVSLVSTAWCPCPQRAHYCGVDPKDITTGRLHMPYYLEPRDRASRDQLSEGAHGCTHLC